MASNDDYWKKLADDAADAGDDGNLWVPPDYRPDPSNGEFWSPDLNPTQQKIFDDMSMTVVGYGEKGSGKTIAFADKGVRHCYETHNGLWLIITVTISVGTEGIWHDLQDFTLPRWRDGNRFPDWLNGERHPHAGELMDGGIGLHYTESKLDPNSKDRHIWVFNKHGTWSKILLKSIPHPSQVETRVKGPAPSMVYVDELTNCDGPEYYTWPAAQLSRRRATYTPMQYCASCNPKGPKHWVYTELIAPALEEDEGKRDKSISVYHVPIKENRRHLNPNYLQRLNSTLKNPYERRRLLDGEWVDMPSGEAIFKEWFVAEIHVKGDSLGRSALMPYRGVPILVGHDPGPRNYSIHMLQRVETDDPGRPFLWTVFDELNYVGKKTPYPVVVRDLIRRMRYWMAHPTAGFPYPFLHITDEQAFTQVNNAGDFDIMDIQREATKQGFPFRMRPCPKGADTVSQRVSMLVDMLLFESLFISGICEKTIDMFRLLESKKAKEGEFAPEFQPQPKSIHKHPLDSLTYPIWKFHVKPGRAVTGEAEPRHRVFVAGSGDFNR